MEKFRRNWEEFGTQDPLWAILAEKSKKGGKWTPHDFFDTGITEVNALMARARAAGIVLPMKRALDFGCGVGRLSQALACYFEYVCGVDISSSMIEHAKSYNQWGDRCQYFVNTSDDLALFDSDYFDFIYSTITLQHIPPRYAKSYIREFLRVTCPQGLLVFQIPSQARTLHLERLKFLVANTRRRVIGQPIMHMFSIPRNEVASLVQQAGGELVDIVARQACGDGWESFDYWVRKP
jgi:ubiquinone/menaquinone biosynthesis C-methylase UbiE